MIRKVLFAASLAATSGASLAYVRSDTLRELTGSGRPPAPTRIAPARPQVVAEPKYQGTSIRPHPGAAGFVRNLQQRIALELSAAEPEPDVRLLYFEWIQDHDVTFTGWLGVIEQASGQSGNWIARVRITPRLVTDDGATAVADDQLIETYECVAGRVRFVNMQLAPGTHPGVIMTY